MNKKLHLACLLALAAGAAFLLQACDSSLVDNQLPPQGQGPSAAVSAVAVGSPAEVASGPPGAYYISEGPQVFSPPLLLRALHQVQRAAAPARHRKQRLGAHRRPRQADFVAEHPLVRNRRRDDPLARLAAQRRLRRLNRGRRSGQRESLQNGVRGRLSALRPEGGEKGRTQAELHAVIHWLTGYDEKALQQQLDDRVDFETFFAQAPRMNPNVSKITGVICGYRVEEIEDPLMQQIRYLDKLVDELAEAKGHGQDLEEVSLRREWPRSLPGPGAGFIAGRSASAGRP